jgi:hypothetical protein
MKRTNRTMTAQEALGLLPGIWSKIGIYGERMQRCKYGSERYSHYYYLIRGLEDRDQVIRRAISYVLEHPKANRRRDTSMLKNFKSLYGKLYGKRRQGGK